ncbi:MAG: glycosyltransferase family 39 protein [Anaerolineae bacterium]
MRAVDHEVRLALITMALLLAMALRFPTLAAQSLWADEGNSITLARAGLVEIAARTAYDIHPPLYYWLLHGWTRLTGDNEVAVRSLSTFADLLLIAITYRLARRLFGHCVAFVAAFAAAVSPFQVYYAQEARMYTLLALLGGLTAWAAVEAAVCIRSEMSARLFCWRWLALYIVSATMGLYTHYAFPVVWGAVVLAGWVYLWRHRGTRNIRQLWILWLFCQLLPLILYVPWLPIAVRQLTTWPAPATALSCNVLATIWNTLVAGPVGAQLPTLWPIVLALLAGVGLVRLILHAELPQVVLVVLYFILPIGLTVVLFKPAYLKFLLAAAPAWCIVLAVALVGTRKSTASHYPLNRVMPWLGALLIALAAQAPLIAYYTDPKLARDDYRGLARYLEAAATTQDSILLNAPGQQEVFGYYYRGDAPIYPLPRTRPPDVAATTVELTSIAARSRHIYAVYWATDESDPQGIVEHWLRAHCFEAGQWWVGNLRVAAYAAPPPTGEWIPARIRFGAYITLTGYRIAFPTPSKGQPVAEPGDILRVQLRWQTDAPLPTPYTVFIQALDSANHLVGQRDAPPLLPSTTWQVGQEIVDQHGLLILPGTPPGKHRLIVGLYDGLSGERLPVAPSTTGVTTDYVTLAPFEVIRPRTPLPEAALWLRHPARIRVGPFRLLGSDCFKLGHDSDPEAAMYPGDPLHIVLYWRAESPPRSNWRVRLEMLPAGEVTALAKGEYPLAGVEYPASRWGVNEVVRAQYDLFVSPEAMAREYRLYAWLDNGTETIALPDPICSFSVRARP